MIVMAGDVGLDFSAFSTITFGSFIDIILTKIEQQEKTDNRGGARHATQADIDNMFF